MCALIFVLFFTIRFLVSIAEGIEFTPLRWAFLGILILIGLYVLIGTFVVISFSTGPLLYVISLLLLIPSLYAVQAFTRNKPTKAVLEADKAEQDQSEEQHERKTGT